MGSQQGRREPAGEKAAGTHRVQQDAILLVLLGVQHVITVGRGGQRSDLEPIPTAFPHLLPGPHHSWQKRMPTKPGSYVPSGSIATGLLSLLRLRGRATDRGKGRTAPLYQNRAGCAHARRVPYLTDVSLTACGQPLIPSGTHSRVRNLASQLRVVWIWDKG